MVDRIRYGVVGLGNIAQAAVLPAFEQTRVAQLAAVVSGDETKREELGRRYGAEHRVGYEQFDALLEAGKLDAVYLALPNHLHCEYTERAARAGVHVLCEKPMAVAPDECERMMRACDAGGVKLMIAYRLHFEPANLHAVELVRSGSLGDPRVFESTFTADVPAGDIRLEATKGGGCLYDIGVYCINAARYLFRAEPTEVYAASESRESDPRFDSVEEMSAVMLRFPGNRLATFVASFGASATAGYRVIGTRGSLRLEPAYSYTSPLTLELMSGHSTRRKIFERRDQFAAEIERFAQYILGNVEPEPDGRDGLADVRIVEAAYRSARERRPIQLQLGDSGAQDWWGSRRASSPPAGTGPSRCTPPV